MIKIIEDRICYNFKDKSLLRAAATHSSYSKERGGTPVHNERLEFLGDAYLDAIIGERLYKLFPDKEEGFLSRTRASLVCERSLSAKARSIDLGEVILLGKGEEKTGGRNRDSILADAMEAIIGAAYLDGGYEAAESIVLRLWEKDIENARVGKFLVTDYKTALQEALQAEGITTDKVKYIDAGEEGPDHKKIFTVRLEIDGKTAAEGKGKSKKQAQQICAEIALKRRSDAI